MRVNRIAASAVMLLLPVLTVDGVSIEAKHEGEVSDCLLEKAAHMGAIDFCIRWTKKVSVASLGDTGIEQWEEFRAKGDNTYIINHSLSLARPDRIRDRVATDETVERAARNGGTEHSENRSLEYTDGSGRIRFEEKCLHRDGPNDLGEAANHDEHSIVQSVGVTMTYGSFISESHVAGHKGRAPIYSKLDPSTDKWVVGSAFKDETHCDGNFFDLAIDPKLKPAYEQ